MMLTFPELSRICRGFSMLLHSGITLADGAFLLAQEEPEPINAQLTQLGRALDGGASLSDALEQSGSFPEHLWAMVRVGEATGRLEAVLDSLGTYYENRDTVNRRVRSALTYPGMVLFLMLLVIGVLLVKVLPIFEKVYASLGQSLTGTAAGLVQTGQLLERCLPGLLALLGIAAAAGAVLYRWPRGREALLRCWQQRFGDRGIGRKFHNAHMAQALSMTVAAGLMPEAGLELALQLLGSSDAARRCNGALQAIKEGRSFPEALEEAQLLSPAQQRMLRVGLRSGSDDRILAQLARELTQEAWDALDQAVSAIEPALVLIGSGLIGLILLTVMLPLAQILSAIG